MKRIIFTLLLFSVTHLSARLNTRQSHSEILWQKIESSYFRVVYPIHLKDKAQYVLNLLEHYRAITGKDYKSKPSRISIILRPDIATPNGFVTLAPRRSEWFTHANIFPFVGSLEWYQTLAIHEYRHVVQYDHFSKGNTRFGYYLFGGFGLGVLIHFVTPNWFFEGDAVWAETVYSDGGRGRSPRFSARLKALIMSDQIPTFDDLLAGDFEVPLVNYYSYGYVLVTYGIKKYGKDIWRNVTQEAADRPYNLLAFYSVFKKHTGENFDDFYLEVISDLKKRWDKPSNDFLKTKTLAYSDHYFPFKYAQNKYYLKRAFNDFLSLYRNDKKLIEIRNSPELSRVDFKQGSFLYVQENVDRRYFFKNTSDIFIYNEQEHKQITFHKKYFHPRFHPHKKQILAILKNDQDEFLLEILDLAGKPLQKIRLENGKIITQAAWVNDEKLALLATDKTGAKVLALYNLKDRQFIPLLTTTKNNLFNITPHQRDIYFEADYQGKVNIFKYSLDSHQISQCTNEYIAASMPSVYENDILFVTETAQGKKVKSVPKKCQALKSDEILAIDKYISNGPSDNYHQVPPVFLKDHLSYYEGEATPQKYDENKGAFSPHSWSFIGGRGFQLEVNARNQLGSFATNAAVGSISEEGTGFASFDIDYSKYYPIFNLSLEHAKRNVLIDENSNSWTETQILTSLSLPFFQSHNFYNGAHSLTFGYGAISVTDNDYIVESKLSNETLAVKSITLNSSYLKSLRFQSIHPDWGVEAQLQYTDLQSNKTTATNYLAQYKFDLYAPGLVSNDGFQFSFSGEQRPQSEALYLLQSEYVPTVGYLFSRGYAYEFTPRFDKISSQYSFPISFPKAGLSDWIYITRIYSQVFYDYTKLENSDFTTKTLGSHGVEFIFDTNVLRKLPISLGIRLVHQQRNQLNQLGFFLTLLN